MHVYFNLVSRLLIIYGLMTQPLSAVDDFPNQANFFEVKINGDKPEWLQENHIRVFINSSEDSSYLGLVTKGKRLYDLKLSMSHGDVVVFDRFITKKLKSGELFLTRLAPQEHSRLRAVNLNEKKLFLVSLSGIGK